jgi:electron transfer flavoprotein beta subunit
MKIVVLVKEVPDTYGDRKLNLETGLAERGAGEVVLDEIGERALEVALAHADAHPGTEVVALMVAPESAATTLRKALSMGAASAVHVVDGALVGADLTLTAQTLAAALGATGFDLVITGNQSTDGSGGVMPAMLAEHLGVPALTALSAVQIGDDEVSGERVTDSGRAQLVAPLPAVISITEALPDARFPSFKGIMAAKKKPVQVIPLAELGVVADDPELSRSIVLSVAERPARTAGTTITDSGDAGVQLAEYLVAQRLV